MQTENEYEDEDLDEVTPCGLTKRQLRDLEDPGEYGGSVSPEVQAEVDKHRRKVLTPQSFSRETGLACFPDGGFETPWRAVIMVQCPDGKERKLKLNGLRHTDYCLKGSVHFRGARVSGVAKPAMDGNGTWNFVATGTYASAFTMYQPDGTITT